jgi:hypothetical protein
MSSSYCPSRSNKPYLHGRSMAEQQHPNIGQLHGTSERRTISRTLAKYSARKLATFNGNGQAVESRCRGLGR